MALTILVVEDSLMNREIVRALLTAHGEQVHAVGSGEEALEALAGRTFDLILLDYELPGMNGAATAAAIRTRHGEAVPIFAMTGHHGAEYRDACVAAGMNGVLQKPLTEEALCGVLDRMIAGYCRDAALKALGDRRLCDRVIAAFRTESPRLLADARAALDAGDAETARALAHRLRGALRYFGAAEAVDRVAQFEELAKSGRLGAPAREALDGADAACRRLDAALGGTS